VEAYVVPTARACVKNPWLREVFEEIDDLKTKEFIGFEVDEHVGERAEVDTAHNCPSLGRLRIPLCLVSGRIGPAWTAHACSGQLPSPACGWPGPVRTSSTAHSAR
jgi:hypothetical protein